MKRDLEESWIWVLPPIPAKVDLEELYNVKHSMYLNSRHVFMCPVVMTGKWRKQLKKIADTTLSLSVPTPQWGSQQFETLTLDFVCSILDSFPWTVYRWVGLADWKNQVPRMLWSHTSERSFLSFFTYKFAPILHHEYMGLPRRKFHYLKIYTLN